MEIVNIPIWSICVGPRIREVDEAAVQELAESIARVGLLNPITVNVSEETSSPVLLAGVHRMEACRRLGWEEVPAQVINLPKLQRRLVQIDENLVRADLTLSERASFMTARKLVYEEMHPEARHGGDRGNQHTGGKVASRKVYGLAVRSFVADTAARTGRSVSSVEKDVQRGERIAGDVLETVVGTELDKGVHLDALAALPAERQREVADRILEGDVDAAKEILSDRSPETRLNVVRMPGGCTRQVRLDLDRIQRAWDGSCEEAHERFLARLEKRRAKKAKPKGGGKGEGA